MWERTIQLYQILTRFGKEFIIIMMIIIIYLFILFYFILFYYHHGSVPIQYTTKKSQAFSVIPPKNS